jgi:hypothetical protein
MKVQLPAFVIAGLYKDTLVVTSDAAGQQKPMVQAAEKKWYLGDNKREIVIVAKDEQAVFINDEWLDTLTRMLGRLKINLGDTAIINLFNTPVKFADIKERLNARHILMFGVTTTEIGLPFTIPAYQVQNYAGCTIVGAPAETLTTQAATTEHIKAEKWKLWESLQRINF